MSGMLDGVLFVAHLNSCMTARSVWNIGSILFAPDQGGVGVPLGRKKTER